MHKITPILLIALLLHGPLPLPHAPQAPAAERLNGPTVYVPLLLSDAYFFFTGPFEQEPNNSGDQPNGALIFNQDYQGYPNDLKDYFSFNLPATGVFTITLDDHSGMGVQLQLFYDKVTVDNRVAADVVAPFQIAFGTQSGENPQAGWYFIYIYTAAGWNEIIPYTLRVTYP
jgi:hypothetical protein